jgi:diguanylate cyclase (GGDEF)-like protein
MDGLIYSVVMVATLSFLMAIATTPMAVREQRPRSSVAYGVGFLLVGVGALLLAVRLMAGAPVLLVLLQNVALGLGMSAIWAGTWMRCGQPVPWRAIALLLLAWFGAFVPFMLWRDLPLARSAVVGACVGIGSAGAAWCILTRKPNRNFADNLLALNFLAGVATELWIVARAAGGGHEPLDVWFVYGITMPVIFVGMGIFVFQSYAIDSFDELSRRSETDPLTGLLNRRAFDERLAQAVANARRHQRPLSLMLADLDHFKRVNDTYGHSTGDDVLMAFAELLARVSRQGDVVARTGGEEFAVVMPETAGASAREYAERLRVATEQLRARRVPMTGSFGVAEVADGRNEARSLLDAADTALYLAKDRGRNRVELYATGQPLRREQQAGA